MPDELLLQQIVDKYNIPLAVLKAVCDVESSGSGFLPIPCHTSTGVDVSGYPKILYEGHIFYRLAKARGLPVARWSIEHPTLVYQQWTRAYYSKKPQDEYQRYAVVSSFNLELAVQSCSWGAFQIMGMNFKECGFKDWQSFFYAMQNQAGQVVAFTEFIKTKNLIPILRDKDWAGFARVYNGPEYAQNNYDSRLATAYNKYKG
jgi:hypothetical protein